MPTPMRVHLDTDLGGDTDDACALAYLLGRPEVDLVGVTTVADADGMRAAYARHLIGLAGRDVPAAAGAGLSLTTASGPSPSTGTGRHARRSRSRPARRSTCSTGPSTPARPSSASARLVRLVTAIDGEAFGEHWLSVVEALAG
jgi:inosine-uridine nucleoside N-ribohydrolase